MSDHLDTFALMPLGAGSADLSGLTTAVLSYEAGAPATAAEIEWSTADGTLQHAVLSHDLVSLG